MKISSALQNSGSKKRHFVCNEEIIFVRRLLFSFSLFLFSVSLSFSSLFFSSLLFSPLLFSRLLSSSLLFSSLLFSVSLSLPLCVCLRVCGICVVCGVWCVWCGTLKNRPCVQNALCVYTREWDSSKKTNIELSLAPEVHQVTAGSYPF